MKQNTLKFIKMHGLGNDFCIINAINIQQLTFKKNKIRQLADRHLGIGFDQLLIIYASLQTDADFLVKIYNADGSVAKQCGNGLRCVARFIHENKLITSNKFTLHVANENYDVIINNLNNIKINMKTPKIIRAYSSIDNNNSNLYTNISVQNDIIKTILVSMNNNHAVTVVKNVADTNVEYLGDIISKKSQFADGCNVNFAEIINHNTIKLRVYERGVGETLACGSGACATVAALLVAKLIDTPATIIFQYGNLTVYWQQPYIDMFLEGSADVVFSGEFSL